MSVLCVCVWAEKGRCNLLKTKLSVCVLGIGVFVCVYCATPLSKGCAVPPVAVGSSYIECIYRMHWTRKLNSFNRLTNS